ncbi:unnamed protein product [Natator depressus]
MINKSAPYRITAQVCSKWPSDVEPTQHDEGADMVPNSVTAGEDADDSDESVTELLKDIFRV